MPYNLNTQPATDDGRAICEMLEAVYDRLGSILSRLVENENKPMHLSAADLYAMTHRSK
jgi:hypothetical protein